MNKLEWEKNEEKVAITYAETCPQYVHNPDITGLNYGENLFSQILMETNRDVEHREMFDPAAAV